MSEARHRVFAICGLPRSGKSVTSRHLEDHHGAVSYDLSALINLPFTSLRLSPERQIRSDYVEFMYERFGQGVFATEIAMRIVEELEGSSRPRLIAVDGVRYPFQLKIIEDAVAKVGAVMHILYLEANDGNRHARALQGVKTADHGKSLAEFLTDDQLPTELGTLEIRSMLVQVFKQYGSMVEIGAIIQHNDGLDALHGKLDQYVNWLLRPR